MKLPHGDRAIVPDAKLIDYALNPEHPDGHHKAHLFRALLTIDRSNAHFLRDALLRAAKQEEVVDVEESRFGSKYKVEFSMTGPRGEYRIMSVWITTPKEPRPVLVTTYIR